MNCSHRDKYQRNNTIRYRYVNDIEIQLTALKRFDICIYHRRLDWKNYSVHAHRLYIRIGIWYIVRASDARADEVAE